MHPSDPEHREQCLPCAYDHACQRQDAIRTFAHEEAKRQLEEFRKAHPDAGRLRQLLFELTGV